MSVGLIVLLALIVVVAALAYVRSQMTRRRRASLRAQRLSDVERAALARYMPVYGRLPADLKDRLDGLIHQFLAEIDIYGAGGLEVTDAMKRLIAAQATLLLVGAPGRWFHSLRTIHLYPAGFTSKISHYDGAAVHERDEGRSGESWTYGPVILSWRDASLGAADPDDGRNVVYHEFAHQLDHETGVVDGAPLLDREHSAGRWARVMQAHYDDLIEKTRRGERTLLDAYGATSPAEFFAVATEHFFEQPEQLFEARPALFEELKTYFNIDPRAWK